MGELIRVTDVHGHEHFIGVYAIAAVVFYTHHPQLEAHITTTAIRENPSHAGQALVVVARGEHAEQLLVELRQRVGVESGGAITPSVRASMPSHPAADAGGGTPPDDRDYPPPARRRPADR